jgi:anaphase-promoting complex subunit 1
LFAALCAGFLYGLGLLGHLSSLTVTDVCEYLIQGHDPTTIAVLIGSAASKLGTADALASRTICLHLPPLLPPQHWDIDISPQVQTAALVSLGLLYCRSGHRLMTEFLLAELSRSPASDRCEDREGMVTAAAWALGMVLLGKGGRSSSSSSYSPATAAGIAGAAGSSMARAQQEQRTKEAMHKEGHERGGQSVPSPASSAAAESGMRSLVDLQVERRLLQHIDGGQKPAESLLFPQYHQADVSSRSSRMLEGSSINTNITAPGAIIALGLIYIRTQNETILQRLALPTTVVALDAIWPDILIYRALSVCLIRWEAVEPTKEWIHKQIPEAILKAVFPAEYKQASFLFSSTKDPKYLYAKSAALDGRVAFVLYICAFSGFCYGIGVVHAGTADPVAAKTLLTHLKLLQRYNLICCSRHYSMNCICDDILRLCFTFLLLLCARFATSFLLAVSERTSLN